MALEIFLGLHELHTVLLLAGGGAFAGTQI
jgi:hypothetical protein